MNQAVKNIKLFLFKNLDEARAQEHGQSVLEYAIILAVVSAAFIAMAMYVRRAVQGQLYKIEDRISAVSNETPGVTPPGGGW